MARKQNDRNKQAVDAQTVGTARSTEQTGREADAISGPGLRQIGEVQIEKDVVSEQRSINVPVTEERVHVERRAVDRPVNAGDAAFQEGTIQVPVRGEEVELQKRTKVAEEVEIGKEAVQRTEQVSGTVRREEVRVNEVDTTATTGTTRTTETTDTMTEGEGLLDRAADAVTDRTRGNR